MIAATRGWSPPEDECTVLADGTRIDTREKFLEWQAALAAADSSSATDKG